ncbi:FAD-dependent oxidoreductase [Rhodococcus oxybenzonivorans]|uniref:NAD(P)/FAD-dependent oxidoreductase n=1 Tax=Rhodococcus oxybenzonivorans TaxID=1990687 RepID=UPI0029541183|nr:FAD-dependent oxidoreductase [Rhodococcus oxybenzonivorans]MDV7353753.1 FAD-dependent oxidoreductase [Rhodococcus oxybenzonivorans]
MDALVIGASVAGVATADALRAKGLEGKITLVDSEAHLPYDKPPLSKQALSADWDPTTSWLRPEQHYRDKGIDLVLGKRAVSLDRSTRTVAFHDGTELTADVIVVATGVTARRLPEEFMLPGVHTIRTLGDSLAVQQALAADTRLVIIGGGFIGAEAAAVAAELGADVTIVETRELPFAHLFGDSVARAMATQHQAHGVRLRCGVGVDRVEGAGRVERVVLTDGTVLEADLVILGLGAVPASEWLVDSGVTVQDGVICDQFGGTTVAGVYAAGDVAAWWDPQTQTHRRIEHWTTAKEHGAAVAHNILFPAAGKTAAPVPYFWSDQYGRRLQFLGTSMGFDATHIVHGNLDDNEYVMLYGREGRLIGALGLAATRQLMAFRPLIAQRVDWNDVVPSGRAELLSEGTR